jgi:hypothetical protein
LRKYILVYIAISKSFELDVIGATPEVPLNVTTRSIWK